MKKWAKNLKSIIADNDAGVCPHCSSENTDYSIKNTLGDVGYADIWCNDCKKAVHISRMSVFGIKSKGKADVPKGLIY